MRYPLLAPLAAFAAGIVAAQHATFSFRELLTSILLLAGLALLGLLRGARRSGAAACLTGFALAGALWMSLPSRPRRDLLTTVVDREALDLRIPVRLRGWVRVPPTIREDRDQFVLAVESLGEGIPANGGVRVTAVRRAGEAPLELHYGDRIETAVRLRRLRNFENPGGFDRVDYLLRQDIHMTGSVRPGSVVERLQGRGGTRFWTAVWGAREWAASRVDSLPGASPATAAVVKACVLGEKAYLDRALGVSFQRTGTYHALVVSGHQVAILAWFFLVLFRHLHIPRGWGALLVMALLIGFALLVGSQLPVIRATAMVAAFLIGRQLYRQRCALNILAATALGMLLVDPMDLFDVSFQLTFLSVALIAGVALPILERTLEPYRVATFDLPNVDRDIHLPPKLAQTRIEWRMAARHLPLPPRLSLAIFSRVMALAVAAGDLVVLSGSVQLGLSLPMAVYFQRISWSGLSANLFVIPLMSLIVPLGFAAIATGWTLLGQAVSALVTLTVAIVEWHARLAWLEARVPPPPVWFGCLFAAALIAFAFAIGRRRHWQYAAALALAAAVAVLVLHPFAPRLEAGRLELTALDVGQGEALFLATPQGQTMLIDGGGLASFGGAPARSLDVGENVVSPYLWSRSIRSLDVVAISHAHYDHIGGLPALLENFQVQELWVGNNPSTPDYERVLDTARRRGVALVRLARGDVQSLGGVAFEALAPAADYVPRSTPSNDDSLVLMARFGRRSFLLAGDIERRAERGLYQEGLASHADVLKVPHHGSKTSTTGPFLALTSPWFALVSAGYDNPYGHPHPDVAERLAERNTSILRTDQHGRVTVSTDGHRIFVSTYAWERRRSRPALVE